MQIINFDNYTFRSSSTGALMSESVGKSNMELYDEAVLKLRTTKESLLAKITENDKKIADTPEDKQKNAPYRKLKEKAEQLSADFDNTIAGLIKTVDNLEKIKHETSLGKTCIAKLIEIYNFEKHGILPSGQRKGNKYTKKGNIAEDESIELLGDLDEAFYIKNDERKSNEWVQGECDIDDEFNDRTVDAKSSWSLDTFQKKTEEKLSQDYWWQGQVYMWLWGRKKHMVYFALINTPKELIEDEMKRLLYEMGTGMAETVEYRQACEQIKIAHNFSDIPKEERIIKYPEFDFDPAAIERLKSRVIQCRKWLNDYAKSEYERCYNNNQFLLPKNPIPVLAVPTEEEPTREEIKKIVSQQLTEILTEAATPSPLPEIVIEQVKATTEQINELSDKIVEAFSENPPQSVVNPLVQGEWATPVTVIQKDLETEIAEVKDEKSSVLQEIETCKSIEDTIALYSKIGAAWWSLNLEVKEKLTQKKLCFLNTAPPTPAPKPNLPPPPAAPAKQIVPPTDLSYVKPMADLYNMPEEEKAKMEADIRKKVEEAPSQAFIQKLYTENKPFVDSREGLKAFLTNKGKTFLKSK